MDSPSAELPATIVRRSRVRFVVMVLAGLAAALTAGLSGRWIEAPAIGWAVASLTYVLWVWIVIGRLDPAGTRSHAITEDPSKGVTDLLILAANLASLAAVAAVVVDSHRGSASGQDVLAGGLLALSCVALSWMLVQTLFTLRYAELYYDPEKRGDEPGGISFNQDRPPLVLRLRVCGHQPGHDLPGLRHEPGEPQNSRRGTQARAPVLPLRHLDPGDHYQSGDRPRQLIGRATCHDASCFDCSR